MISDETFNDRSDKIIKFADVVEKLHFVPWFTGYIRADLLISRPQDREELLRMNVLGQYYGVETFDTRSAKAIGKGMNGDRLKQGLVDIRDYFTTHGRKQYRGTLSFILGLPYESIESIYQTNQWLVDNWQGQSFIAHSLEIPTGEFEKPSKLSLNYKKYGYRESTAPRKLATKSVFAKYEEFNPDDNCLWWENDYMNRQRASELVEEFIKIRKTYDFKTECFALAERWANACTLEEKLPFRHNQLIPDNNVQWYIDKKLSI
jgi:radical SAM superfamily enzyme YgiQ (UPF0313 family)